MAERKKAVQRPKRMTKSEREAQAAAIAEATAVADETLWERRMRALTMRNGGATFTQIAEKIGVPVSTARADVRIAKREFLSETAEEMIARQRGILSDLQRAHYVRALQGDPDSTRAIMSTLDHEARLFGLYAPARVNVGVSEAEFNERLAEMFTRLGLVGSDVTPSAAALADVIDAAVVEEVPPPPPPEEWSTV